MRLLLDTHALVWYVEADPRLPAARRTDIQDAANEVWISPASYWEIAIKVHLGKWSLTLPYMVLTDTPSTSTGSGFCTSSPSTPPG